MDARTISFEIPADAAENRRAERVAAEMRAKVRDRYGNKYDVHVLDLSVTGFRADADFAFDAGQIVWLTIPGMEGLEATIAWRRGRIIGARFNRQLYPAVLDHVVRTIRV